MSGDQGEAVEDASTDLRFGAGADVDEAVLDDGSTVLLDASSGAMAQLDVIGALVWRALRFGPTSVRELAADLADAFEQPSEVTAPAAEELVDRLASLGLVEPVLANPEVGGRAVSAGRARTTLPDPPSP